jgi:hypothetical protein
MERPTTATALWRRLALGAGPLKRGSDRLQFLARLLLGCTLLTALPVALTVATATHSDALAEATAQAAERREVDATLTEDAPRLSDSYDAAHLMSLASVVWTAPSGRNREGRVPVPQDATAGSVVRIWIDRDGEHTTRPLSRDDVAEHSVAAALRTYLCISVIVCGLYLAFRKGLDSSRMRRWDADWALVEPVWTRGTL